MRCTCWILHWLDLDGTSCTVAIAVLRFMLQSANGCKINQAILRSS